MRRGAVEPGHLPVIAALEALDGMPIEADPAERAVMSDNGRAIRLMLYSKAGAVADVELDPIRAVALAGRLIDAALRRQPKTAAFRWPEKSPRGRRGTRYGDETGAPVL